MSPETPPCKGSTNASDHRMVKIGNCAHEVGGATYVYAESGCEDCGVTARKTEVFMCGTGAKRVQPTVDNCRALAWKAARQAALS